MAAASSPDGGGVALGRMPVIGPDGGSKSESLACASSSLLFIEQAEE
jgi:hypothetical protein